LIAVGRLVLSDRRTDGGGGPNRLQEQDVRGENPLDCDKVLHNGQASAGSDGEVVSAAVAGVGSRLQEMSSDDGSVEGWGSIDTEGRTKCNPALKLHLIVSMKKSKESEAKERKEKKKKRKEGKKKANLGLLSSPVSPSMTPRQALSVTSALISRRVFKQRAEATMLIAESFVPVMHLTNSPFAFSKGKQETVQRGPNSRTHSTR